MPVYKGDEGKRKIAEERERLLDCLAEWILTHFKTKQERNNFLDRMHERRVGPNEAYKEQADVFIEDLKQRVLRVWESRKK